jgi:hypothetical protein
MVNVWSDPRRGEGGVSGGLTQKLGMPVQNKVLVASCCGRPEVVCHFLSSCVHASITSKSDSKVFGLSDKFQRCAGVSWESNE